MAILYEEGFDAEGPVEGDSVEILIRKIIKNKTIKQIMLVEDEDVRRPIGQAYQVLRTLVRSEENTKFDIVEKDNEHDFIRLMDAVRRVPSSLDVK